MSPPRGQAHGPPDHGAGGPRSRRTTVGLQNHGGHDHEMSISTHVLDATSGRPAAGLEVALSRQDAGRWHELARRRTDADGRVSDLAAGAGLTGADSDAGPGIYRIVFLTEAYLKARSPAAQTFYPEVVVTFRVSDPAEHHHVPLLLSPYAYSTYRGS